MPIEKTSSRVAKKAASILRSEKTSSRAKTLAGSALTQSRSTKTTSPSAARKAAKVLASPSAGKSAKTIAASVLTQKSKTPFPVKTYRVAGATLTQKASAQIVRKVAKKK